MGREALLRAIIEAPQDDAARLVYADWLQEHGSGDDLDRGQLIRLQVEEERQPAHSRRRCELKWQAERLLGRHRRTWLKVLPWWADDFNGAFFKRGFVDRLYVRSNHFVEEFPELPTREPITGLFVNCSPDNVPVQKLLALQGLGRLRGLDFGAHHTGGKGAAALADCASFRNLERLHLSANKIGPAGVRALARSPYFEHLEALGLSSNALGTGGVSALVTGHLPALKELSLDRKALTSAGFKRLFDSELGKRLRRLSLSGGQGTTETDSVAADLARAKGAALASLSLIWVRIGDAGVSDLARAEHLGGLVDLSLHGCACGAEGVRDLARATHFTALTRLAIPYGEMGDAGVAALAEARSWPGLQRLSLHSQPFSAAGMAALAQARWPLGELDLSGCDLDAQAIECLAGSPLLAGLHTLNLERNKIGPAGACALARSPHAAGLIDLNLSHNGIDAGGAKVLAESDRLRSLRRLNLEFNPIGDRGGKALAASAWLQQIVDLDLSCTGITGPGAKALADRLDPERFGRVRLYGCQLGRPLAQELWQRFGGRVAVSG